MKHTPASIIGNTLKWILLVSLLALALLPLLWLLISSLRTNLELQTNPFGWPEKFQWVNYANALSMASLPRLLLNSVVVAVVTVVLNSLVTSMGAFILSREHFKGRDIIYTILTAGVLVPVISFMVPYFSMITRSGLYNTLACLDTCLYCSEYSCFYILGDSIHEIHPQGVGGGCHHGWVRLLQAFLHDHPSALPLWNRNGSNILLHLLME